MHVPDGFINAPTSLAAGVVAAGTVAVALRKAGDELDEKTTPMAGLVAAFIFATQMLTFPVGVGTSGHLLGGALAAVLVGPWTAILCMSTVLLVQALLFADGGLTALGTNVVLMGLVTVAVGWAITAAITRVGPNVAKTVTVGAALGALVSVPAAAIVFVGLFEVGGTVDVQLSALLSAMVGWHLLIGVGEAVITWLTVSSILAVRPDLVYAARHMLSAPTLELRTPADPAARAGRPTGLAP